MNDSNIQSSLNTAVSGLNILTVIPCSSKFDLRNTKKYLRFKYVCVKETHI